MVVHASASLNRETRDSQSGGVLEALCPCKRGVSVETAKRLLGSVTDLEVVVHVDDAVHERPPRSVKRADLEDTDAEDEDCTGTTAGRKGVLGFAPGSQLVPRASSAASVETGRADGRLGNASQVLGRREGLACATPSREPSSAEATGGPGTAR